MFDKHSGHMFLDSFYRGVTPEQVQDQTGFKIDFTRANPAEEPRTEEPKVLREVVDPDHLIV